MTHDATVELLSRYLDGDLGPAEHRKAENLMAEDPEALALYQGLQQVRGSLGQLPEVELPPHLGVLVRRRVALAAEESGLWQRVDARLRRLLVEPAMLPMFAVVLALGAMVYVLNWKFALPLLILGIVILAAYILKDVFVSDKIAGKDRNNEEFQL